MCFQESILDLWDENLGLLESILGLLEWFWAIRLDFLPLEVRFMFQKVVFWSLRVQFSPSGSSLGIC